jgi:hypothetical protein
VKDRFWHECFMIGVAEYMCDLPLLGRQDLERVLIMIRTRSEFIPQFSNALLFNFST